MTKPRIAFTLILSLLLSLTLTACKDKTPKEPPDLRGEWRQVSSEDGAEPQYDYLATIADDEIKIFYVSADGSENLYWLGTFTPPADGKEPYVWTSENKLPQDLSSRVHRYASRDPKKEFTYKKGKIDYMTAPSQALRIGVTMERVPDETE